MSSSLHQALCAERGIVCAIGAGGKKTTLFALLDGATERTGLTASVFTPDFPEDIDASVHVEAPETLRRLLPTDPAMRIAYAQPTDKPRRVGPLSFDEIRELHELGEFTLTLVKADGARMRRIKAPGEHEPRVVPGSTVLAITSIQALGRPLDDRIAHRPERIAEVTGQQLGEPISSTLIARLYTRQGGLANGTGNSTVIPVLNMVDDAGLQARAREVAQAILAESERYDRVVLLSARRSGHLVDIILR